MSGVAFLALVLLRVDVELPALGDRGALDGLTGGTVDAPKQHIDFVVLDELGGLGGGDAIYGCAVLQVQLELPPEQTAAGIDVVDQHFRHVRIRSAHGRKRSRLLGDNAYFDG
jgi:hypothetical protein